LLERIAQQSNPMDNLFFEPARLVIARARRV